LILKWKKMPKILVGTRASELATTQTRWFVTQLTNLFPSLEVEEIPITTEGDLSVTPLSESKTPGVFVSALREKLLAKEVDFIVHSMKDLPAEPMRGIALACVPIREDARDALVSRSGSSLAKLPKGARVGTSSPRRTATIRKFRPDLVVESIRGNVDTRIGLVEQGKFDATVLALAGLSRLGKSDLATEIFPTDFMIPAPGQGALAVELRTEDLELRSVVGALMKPLDLLTTTAERAVLRGLRATCATPIGAFAEYRDGSLRLSADLGVEATGESVRFQESVNCEIQDLAAAEKLGRLMASKLLDSEVAGRSALK
jgi:hydroxymethylbilane synthase